MFNYRSEISGEVLLKQHYSELVGVVILAGNSI